jgi:hypothetical protein
MEVFPWDSVDLIQFQREREYPSSRVHLQEFYEGETFCDTEGTELSKWQEK